jgi:antitoxin component YwqK of YwqJK toxin-antitoxin module
MKGSIVILLIISLLPGAATAWWEVKYDTTKTYWPNGSLKECWTSSWDTGNEKGFIKNGQYTAWYQNGHKSEEGEYLEGLKEYTWIKWYEDGQRAEETSFNKGQKDGRQVAWHTNHDIKFIAYYKDGQRHGSYFSGKPNYDPNNPHLSCIDWVFYLYGHPLLYFYRDGEFKNSIQQAGTQLDTITGFWIEWNKWATEFYIGEKINDKKTGKWVLWSSDGRKINVTTYKDGEEID